MYPLNKEELEALPTKRLLAKLKTLHQCEQSFELSYWEEHEIKKDAECIQFKESDKWIAQYELLKDILRKREYIEK